MKKLKHKYFPENSGFQGSKVNIRFLTEKYDIPEFGVQMWVGSIKTASIHVRINWIRVQIGKADPSAYVIRVF